MKKGKKYFIAIMIAATVLVAGCVSQGNGKNPVDYCAENDGKIVEGPSATGKIQYCLFDESYCRVEEFQSGECQKGENFYECRAMDTESEGYYDKEKGTLIAWYDCGEPVQLPNPAASYCENQGGEYDIREDPRPEGGQYGVCILENGTVCDEWEYYQGGCESCLTYCQKQLHIMCTGEWNITGEYPDCNCEWICDESGPV